MAAYRRVYDSRHLQADCKEPGTPRSVIEYRLPLPFLPATFATGSHFFRCALCEAYSASADLLAEFKGRTKEEYRVGNG